ncbi:MAG TPA: hypothetical protein VK447_20370 [Myxococcaceae bacterium]|nr:hypothetical protein [Myxococcaceae bacterium]
MSLSVLKLLSAVVILTLGVLTPGEAEARFGKAGSGGGKSPSSSGGGGGRGHSASAPGTSRGSSGSGGVTVGSGYYPRRSYYRGFLFAPYYSCWSDPWCTPYAAGYGYRPFFGYARPTVVAPGPQPVMDPEEEQPLLTTIGATAQGYSGGGGGLGVSMTAERNRLGLQVAYDGIFVPTDDGTAGMDSIKLFDAHVTYALLQGDHGRLKVGAGLDTAFAPSIVFMGPGLSASASIGLVGPVGLEGTLKITPYPFIKVDWNAGVALGLGPVGLRGGWRTIYLNDNGLTDGYVYEDLFSGPFVSLGLAL